MPLRIWLLCYLMCGGGLVAAQPSTTQLYEETLTTLCTALLQTQNNDSTHSDFGGLRDPETGLYYSRAAEAVFPFAVLYARTGRIQYRTAAIRLGLWLLRQQKPGGEWIENPWTWTGTTADQLLMMAGAYPLLKQHLSVAQQQAWHAGVAQAADYMTRMMSPAFASINYVPSTAAALALTWQQVEQRPEWRAKAALLASQTMAKMDEDKFIHGEAARYHDVKYGVDIGYQLDMSLWGLALYARILNDTHATQQVRASLRKLLPFVYPNGIIDASWGARCYKWTGYGSKTADGAQVLFSLFAHEDARYQTAATRNLHYLRLCMRDGYVGYGAHLAALPGSAPNLYPTFARAKNLAMALQWGRVIDGPTPAIPADTGQWVQHYPTVNVAVMRTGPWMATASAYGYQDRENWGGGKYHHFPRGGALCNVYLDGWGWLSTSSQTRYQRGEHIHMPAVRDSVICLTPRVEYRDKYGYFTNVYDSQARLLVQTDKQQTVVQAAGEMSDSLGRPGGVAFQYDYAFGQQALTKTLHLRYHDRTPVVYVQEPLVWHTGMQVQQLDDRTVLISLGTNKLRFSIVAGQARLRVGEMASQYWFPFPGLRCYPIVLELAPPATGYTQDIVYSIEKM